MKILVISQYFYPENFRINGIVKELVNRGHTVTVLTGRPNYPDGKIYDTYQESHKKVSNYFGANVYRCKLRPRKSGVFNLALNYLSFVIQAKKTLRRINPDFDIIFFYEPSPISSGIPAIWYGKKHNIKTVIYNLDIWPDCVRDISEKKPLSTKNIVFLIAKSISKKVYSRFDLIINKCDEFGNYLQEVLSIEKDKMITIDEYAENTYLSVNKKPINNGVIDFMFLGNIGKSQNCDQIVKSFSMIKHDNAMLHFVGDGSYLKEIKRLVSVLKLQNKVVFHRRCSTEEVIDFYNLADVCLLTLSNRTASGLTPPTKLSGYMASSRCIVASIDGAAKRIIEKANCGFVCCANDVEGLATLMQKAMDENCENLHKMGQNGRTYFENNFTLEKHIDSLLKSFSIFEKEK